MLSPKTRRTIHRIIPFALIWVVSGWVFLVVELAATGSFKQLPATAIKMDFQLFIMSSLAMMVVGLLTGLVELKFLDHIFARHNFLLRFFYKLLIYSLFFIVVELITYPLAASLELNTHFLDQEVWDKYLRYAASITHLSTGLQLATSLVLSLFYTEISEFIGQSALINFFTGKYHRAVEEERIFMFLDMKSSTTIAEKLGHLEYFELLRAYYECFSDAIVDHEGEIYQYVGDEIILSWKFENNEADNRCLACFFSMRENLRKKAPWFKKKFDVVPSFKAGIHFGKVTAGEIGTIKKEILFSGDVLNATARIQSLCNNYQVDLIVSGELKQQLKLNSSHKVGFLGAVELKGKTEKKELYTIFKTRHRPNDPKLFFQLEDACLES